jgi:hypothetical protein
VTSPDSFPGIGKNGENRRKMENPAKTGKSSKIWTKVPFRHSGGLQGLVLDHAAIIARRFSPVLKKGENWIEMEKND